MVPLHVGSWACLLLSIVSISFACWYAFTYSRRRDTAPSVLGLPLVGSTISLAVQGAGFVHACRKRVSVKTSAKRLFFDTANVSKLSLHFLQYGDIVRLSLGGQRMTYLFGPDAMKLFFSAPDDHIGFRQVTCKICCSNIVQ